MKVVKAEKGDWGEGKGKRGVGMKEERKWPARETGKFCGPYR